MANTPRSLGSEDQEDKVPLHPKGKNFLLAVAIDHYQHCPPLNNAVKDAKDFVALMTEKYSFDSKYVHRLFDEEATHERILNEFKWLVREATPDDSVLIYFSGHGELDDVFDEGFWIPVEADRDKHNQYLPNSTIQKILNRINSFHTFLIVDSCFSGSLFLEGKTRFVSEAYDFASRWGLTSGRNTLVSDGKKGENSPFAQALLGALKRSDAPLNVSALCDVVKQTVAASTNKNQLPVGDPLNVAGHKGGQFVFRPVNDEARDWETASKTNTVKAYSDFIQKYRSGKYANEALQKLELLEETTIWQKVVKNKITSLLRFVRENPDSPFVNEAERLIDDLEMRAEEKPAEQPVAAPKKQPEKPKLSKKAPPKTVSKMKEPSPLLKAPSPVAISVAADALKKSGVNKMNDFECGDAIEDFKKALALSSNDAETHFFIACAYSLCENAKEAYQHLDKAVEFGFNDFDQIMTHDTLAFVRIQNEFDAFVRNGFRLISSTAGAADLYLVDSGPYKINAVKVVKELTSLSLVEAKDIVDHVPSLVMKEVPPNRHAEIRRLFDEIEAKIEFRTQNAKVINQLDAILTKVKDSGYDSLTADEKDFLFQRSMGVTEKKPAAIASSKPPSKKGVVIYQYGDAIYGNEKGYDSEEYLGRVSEGTELLLMDERVMKDKFGLDIIKVRVLTNKWVQEIGKIGWVGLRVTSFSDRFDPKKRVIN